MSFLEAAMLACFGASWPISVLKTLRTKEVSGKSPGFMAVILIGYVCGIFHKIFYSFDWVILLYITNITIIAIDLLLYAVYSRARRLNT